MGQKDKILCTSTQISYREVCINQITGCLKIDFSIFSEAKIKVLWDKRQNLMSFNSNQLWSRLYQSDYGCLKRDQMASSDLVTKNEPKTLHLWSNFEAFGRLSHSSCTMVVHEGYEKTSATDFIHDRGCDNYISNANSASAKDLH